LNGIIQSRVLLLRINPDVGRHRIGDGDVLLADDSQYVAPFLAIRGLGCCRCGRGRRLLRGTRPALDVVENVSGTRHAGAASLNSLMWASILRVSVVLAREPCEPRACHAIVAALKFLLGGSWLRFGRRWLLARVAGVTEKPEGARDRDHTDAKPWIAQENAWRRWFRERSFRNALRLPAASWI
jgi:hypothetical protein